VRNYAETGTDDQRRDLPKNFSWPFFITDPASRRRGHIQNDRWWPSLPSPAFNDPQAWRKVWARAPGGRWDCRQLRGLGAGSFRETGVLTTWPGAGLERESPWTDLRRVRSSMRARRKNKKHMGTVNA